MHARRRSARGFTLIELVISVALVGLLASIAVPMAELTVQRERERELRLALRQIRSALDSYKQAADEGRIARQPDESGYPTSLAALVEGMPDMRNPDRGAKLRFLRRIPRDPMDPDPTKSAEETWGKRSYDSDADRPDDGRDVFDVYSLAAGVGLNKIPYRQW